MEGVLGSGSETIFERARSNPSTITQSIEFSFEVIDVYSQR